MVRRSRTPPPILKAGAIMLELWYALLVILAAYCGLLIAVYGGE